MLAVAARPRLAFGNGQHRLHRDHHARLQHRVDILAQLQPGLAAIEVRQNPERMAIAKGPVLQQLPPGKEVVDLRGDAGTGIPRLQQRHTEFMRRKVRLPDFQAGRIHLTHKHRALQRGVIARDHRKAVEAQNIPALQFPPRQRIMRAIGVDPRLEPDPGVAVFGIGEPFGNLALHRIAARHGDLQLGRAHAHRVADGMAADVGHLRALPDQRNLGRRFHHPLRHGRRRNIHAALGLQKAVQLFRPLQRQMVRLAADRAAGPRHTCHRPPEIVALPVGIGDVVAIAAPPRLACINARADGHAVAGRHHATVGPPETAIQKPRIIGDIVHRGQHDGIQPVQFQNVAQPLQARGVFFRRKRQDRLAAMVKAVVFRALQRHFRPHRRGQPQPDPERSRRTGRWQAPPALTVSASSGETPVATPSPRLSARMPCRRQADKPVPAPCSPPATPHLRE